MAAEAPTKRARTTAGLESDESDGASREQLLQLQWATHDGATRVVHPRACWPSSCAAALDTSAKNSNAMAGHLLFTIFFLLSIQPALSQDTWLPIQALPRKFVGGGCATANRTLLYCFGGIDLESIDAQNSTWMFASDDQTAGGHGKWVTRAEMPTGLTRFGAAGLGGKVYAIGGTTGNLDLNSRAGGFVYTPHADTWATVPDMSIGRSTHAVAAMEDPPALFALGGYTSPDSSGWGGKMSHSVERFDPISQVSTATNFSIV
eukprot:SAG11_NODE_1527_length_4740_cov_20.044172_3_plen_262_part_00